VPGNHNEIEKRLWEAADELRANSKLKASEYSLPVLGLIFLKYADFRFRQAGRELKAKASERRTIGKEHYHARGVLYLPEAARFSNLIRLPEDQDIGSAINEAMKEIEAENDELRGVLPSGAYTKLDNSTLLSLLKTFNVDQTTLDGESLFQGDAFGRIYEYFLSKFAASEGQKGGEFFTPVSLVRLIVEVIEPFHGRIFDPACGSGGMFVQSAKFLESHKASPNREISIFGQDKIAETVRLCKMNLAVHGLSGSEIREGNSYYEDIHKSLGRFDFVMANPPFNVDKVDKSRISDDPRFGLGVPKVDNANYLWIQIFHSALNEKGRAGFVMANSASDARGSELEIRKKIIMSGDVDVMIAIGPNFFYTVTLPCTLWFFDRGKPPERKDRVLFIDARQTFTQVDRAHREFAPEQVEFLANIVRLYRGKEPETGNGSEAQLKESFPEGKYADIAGLCKLATVEEIESQGWSLNPGRYVGVAERAADDFDFAERLQELNEELERLNVEARVLEEGISKNVTELLEGIR